MLLKIRKTVIYGYNSFTEKFNISHLTDDSVSKIMKDKNFMDSLGNKKRTVDNHLKNKIFNHVEIFNFIHNFSEHISIPENNNLFLLLPKPFKIKNKSIFSDYKRVLHGNNILWIPEDYFEEVS